MSGLDRYHAHEWQCGAPQPGELEYLGWDAYGCKNSGTDTRNCELRHSRNRQTRR